MQTIEQEFLKVLQKAFYFKSYADVSLWKKDSNTPEIAFIGRSNSGKSTLINSILVKKGLAKTSRTPGKTKLINVFAIANQFCLVDLPGFGYSKTSHKEHKEMMKLLESYLNQSDQLRHLFLLLDARREIPEEEVIMLETAKKKGINYTLIRTKADKLNQKEKIQSVKDTEKHTRNYMYVSSLTGNGIVELREILRLSVQ
ncbi:ribosome biogenesis GTP-binding protein YihA/YsxC [Leptospira sp. GIMC2001]|uniref:ribosome biogenesis GTP-binding protein YihA/YsxC n=1 Tax=Leptospira sp. GIMC2001 TaxID=1513297 RepID=UPI00234BCD8C|nr:ribosome biogenesis GTP-binding protein YihA/YsxC [Leptospira sp. GIMC2001]WCL49022.1 ribosome biogenesis GTP-binding protein YihA/YsxC [Leptospira sp. GIMC2001]